MQTIEWTAGTGAKIEINFLAMFGLDLQGRRKASGRKEVVVIAKVDGREVEHMGCQDTTHPVAVAKVGPIGLTVANRDRYQAAYQAAAAEIAAHNNACDVHASNMDAISAESDALAKSMSYGEVR
jgi:hypothetical protein